MSWANDSSIGRVFAVAILIVSQAVSMSVSASSIALQFTASREIVETDASGRPITRLVPTDSALAGDEVVYTVTYTNTGSDSWDHVVITDPLAPEVNYLPGSVSGAFADFTVSVDGGKTFSEPDEARVVDEFGYEHPAEPRDYTHLRWLVVGTIAPGASGYVRYRARLE